MISLIVALIIGSCSRTSVPLDDITGISEAYAATRSVATHFALAADDVYAVVWVPESEKLEIRDPAGIAGVVVAELPHDYRGIRSTGRTTALGSSMWMEVRTVDDEVGWVNSWNLTEDVPPEYFCSDPRIADLIANFVEAVENEDGELLSTIVNPHRGLVIRHDWWNPDVVIPVDEVPTLFADPRERDWGELSGGGFSITGSFDDEIKPLLAETLSSDGWVCNILPVGTTSRDAVWPGEFASLNYMAIHKPPLEGGNQFDWRTWALGIEYIEGLPYLSLLLHYRGGV